jgi:hypothetical protein
MDNTSNYGTINSFLVSDIFGEVVKHLGLGDLKPLPLVCKHWNRLYNDEQLWDELLRRNFLDLDSKNFTGTKKDAFFKMIRTKISVLEFSITWLDDHYWTTDNGTAIGSYFDKIAVLNAVCWLHVAGVVNVYPGTYQVIWRVYLKNGHNLQDDLFFEANPLEEGCGVPLKYTWTYRDQQEAPIGQWFDLNIGRLIVNAQTIVPVKFLFHNTVNGYWKGGLCVDYLELRPTLSQPQ